MKPRLWNRLNARSLPLGILMIFPTLGLLVAVFLLPIGIAIRDSFYYVNTISGKRIWVGLENFHWILTSELVQSAFFRSVIYCVVTVGIEIVLAVFIANLLRTNFLGRGVIRALIISPYVIPTIIVVLIWRYLLDPNIGAINLFMGELGVLGRSSPAWLGDTALAFPTAIVVTIWKYTPFMTILLTARLQSVPPELYEAVSIDGGGAWARLRYVTIPWLLPVIAVSVMIRGILTMNEFDLLYLLTGGGPQSSSTTMPLIIRNQAFQELDSGRSSAIAISMALFSLGIVVVAVAMARLREKRRTRSSS